VDPLGPGARSEHERRAVTTADPMAARLYALLVRGRVATLLVLAAVSAVMAAGASRVSFDNSYEIWFLRDDPALAAYEDFQEEFGTDAAVVVAMDTLGDPWSDDTLERVEALSAALGAVPGVEQVWSLTRTEAMFARSGSVAVGRLLPDLPPSIEQRQRARQLTRASPLYRPLVAPDGSRTALVLTVHLEEGSFEPTARLVDAIRGATVDHAGGREVFLGGAPVIDEATYRYSQRDAWRYGPAMVLLVVLSLWLLFRSTVAVAVPLAVVGLAVVWAYGIMGWLGWDATVLTTVLVPILAAVGVADAVHLLHHYRLSAREGGEPTAILGRAFARVLRPCLITSLTTAAGMASLTAALLPATRQLGVAAAAGVLAAFALTVAGIPAALSMLPRSWLHSLAHERGPALAPRLAAVTALSIRHRRVVAAATLAVVVAAGFGVARLQPGARLLSYFFERDPIYGDAVEVDRTLGGSHPLQVLVEARGDADLLEPEAMTRVRRIGTEVASMPATGEPLSGMDFLVEARRVFLGQPPGTDDLPASAAEAAQLLLLLDGGADRTRYLSLDHRRARVEVPVAATRYEQLVPLLPELQRRIDAIAGDVVHARVTGLALLMGRMESYLLTSQLRSFRLAFVLVLGVIAMLFASLRVGVLSAIPNLLPLVLVLGAMGWLRIPLDATTVMVAPILLGIAVDDTVHLLERVLRERRRGADVASAFERAAGEVGHALTVTTVVLVLGFLTPLLGSFKPNLHFALLAALALVLALVADLVVFPALATLAPRLVPR